MENSYWNETGKHQEFVDSALDKAPSFGFTNNIYMNALIIMARVYYDVYNNGGGNIEDCYKADFERYVTPLVSGIDLQDFIDENYSQVETAMDRFLEYLMDKPLECVIYSVWWSYDDKILSQVKPMDKTGFSWSEVTFGSEADKQSWCADQVSFGGVRDITEDIKRLNEIPDVCYSVLASSGELIMLCKAESGYFPCTWSSPSREENMATAARLNGKLGVTEAQVKAMEFGSMFGWDKPGADPRVYMKRPLAQQLSDAGNKADSQSASVRTKPVPEHAK